MTKNKLKTIPFDVQIPNLDGDAIAESIRIDVQAYTDPETGEDVLTPDSLELIEKTQARHMGLMSPDEIKDLRERLDLTQEQMSELLQIGAKTYTRWESDRARPSRSMNVLLCALRDGVISTDYLRCLHDGRDWSMLLNRRVERSIILYKCDRTEVKSSPMRWPHHDNAFDVWLELSAGEQTELALKESAQRRTRRQLQVCRVPLAWEETANAA